MTGRLVDDQVLDSSFRDSLQMFTHRLQVNAIHERRLRLEYVPGLLDERIEAMAGLLGLEMKTTQNRSMLGDGRNWICHSEVPRGFSGSGGCSILVPESRVGSE